MNEEPLRDYEAKRRDEEFGKREFCFEEMLACYDLSRRSSDP